MQPTAMTCVAEKEGKYVASWRPRYVRFAALTRALSYTTDTSANDVWKHTMVVSRIQRLAETKRFDSGTFERRDILVFSVTGTIEKEKTNTHRTVLDDVEAADLLQVPGEPRERAHWVFRFATDALFAQWWRMIREALVDAGLMRGLDGGLPRLDFRFHIPYARVPLELLFFFRLLDTAAFFFIDAGDLVSLRKGPGEGAVRVVAQTNSTLVVGDTTIYVLQEDGNIVRWVDVASVHCVHCGPDFILFEGDEACNADLVFRFRGCFLVVDDDLEPRQPTPADLVQRCCEIVAGLALLQNTSGRNVDIVQAGVAAGQPSPAVAAAGASVSTGTVTLGSYLASQKQLRYTPDSSFAGHVTCPQSKAKLCAIREQMLGSRDLPIDPSSPLLSPRRLKATKSKRSFFQAATPPLQQQQQQERGSEPSPFLGPDMSLAIEESLQVDDDMEAEEDEFEGTQLQLALAQAVTGLDEQLISMDDI